MYKVFIHVFLLPVLALPASLKIFHVRDLKFTKAIQGDIEEIIPATSGLSSEFLISGDAGSVVEILPVIETLKLSLHGSTLRTQNWNTQTSSTLTLPTHGAVTIQVGATRMSMSPFQTPGHYSGEHLIQARYKNSSEIVSQTSKHEIEVLQAISIRKLSNLYFTDLYPGDPSVQVLPESFGAAQFEIAGQPGADYWISLPAQNSVQFKLNNSNPTRALNRIGIRRFNSLPNQMGHIDHRGKSILKIGAELESILSAQASGLYQASFDVRVTYQ